MTNVENAKSYMNTLIEDVIKDTEVEEIKHLQDAVDEIYTTLKELDIKTELGLLTFNVLVEVQYDYLKCIAQLYMRVETQESKV